MSIESVMPSNHLILCRPLLLPPSIFPSIRAFSNDSRDLASLEARDLQSFPSCCFPLFLCIDRWGRLSYLSLLFFGTRHSNGNIFSPLLFPSLLFTAIFTTSSDSHFAFLHFFSMGMILIPVSCTMSQTSLLFQFGFLFFFFLLWWLKLGLQNYVE